MTQAKIEVPFQDQFTNTVRTFFDIFDQNNTGILDRLELVVGIFMLCGGTFREKLTVLGRNFDADNDSCLNLTELSNLFQYFYNFMGFREGRIRQNRQEISETIARKIIEEMGAGSDKVSVDMFSTIDPHKFQS